MRTLIFLAVLLAATAAAARDNGQWNNNSAAVRQWFQGLMQPDNPVASCCGEADGYEADAFEIEGDHYIAIITDTDDDAPKMRPHVDPGTRIPVPNAKMKWDAGNPTGHGIIFLRAGDHYVYCYVTPSGT